MGKAKYKVDQLLKPRSTIGRSKITDVEDTPYGIKYICQTLDIINPLDKTSFYTFAMFEDTLEEYFVIEDI